MRKRDNERVVRKLGAVRAAVAFIVESEDLNQEESEQLRIIMENLRGMMYSMMYSIGDV